MYSFRPVISDLVHNFTHIKKKIYHKWKRENNIFTKIPLSSIENENSIN